MTPSRRWPVISALGVIQILTWGSSFYLPAVLAGPVAQDTGWPLAWVVGGLTLGLLVAGSSAPFAAHATAAQTTRLAAGYGPLRPAGELLALPEGFSYTVLAESGTTTVGGYAVAGSQDAMGAFARAGGGSTIVCNHEIGGADDGAVPAEGVVQLSRHRIGLRHRADAEGGEDGEQCKCRSEEFAEAAADTGS